MKVEGHQEIYRVAHDAATSELIQITAEFERLLLRREQLEKLLSALKPVIGEDEQAKAVPESAPAQSAPQLVTAKPEMSSEAKPEPAAVTDPFQRRVDHVLGIGAGIRDVRQYTRQF